MASTSSRSKQRKREARKGRSEKQALLRPSVESYLVDLPFEVGDYVAVELRNSVRELDEKQREMVRALRLRRQGQTKVIRFRGARTAAKLYPISNVVEVRPAAAPARRAKRSRNSSTSRSVEVDAVNTRVYTAGGGESRLLQVAGAGQLRVEAQTESFALMWPSHLTAAKFFMVVSAYWWDDEGSASLISASGQGVREVPVGELHETLAGKAWCFVRADFADRAFTWALEYRDPERAGWKDAAMNAHEVSLGSTHFDAGYFHDLLRATAVKPLADLGERLTQDAAETLAAYA